MKPFSIQSFAAACLAFAVIVLAALLGICLDFASNYPSPYERVRLVVELLALIGIGGSTVYLLMRNHR